MSKRFIVLSLNEKDSWGWNEQTLPRLIQLVDSMEPDARIFTHTGVVAHFQASRAALKKMEQVVIGAEELRKNDERFSTLGTGIAEGECTTEFDTRGRVKERAMILGDAAGESVRSASKPNEYKETLQNLKNSIPI